MADPKEDALRDHLYDDSPEEAQQRLRLQATQEREFYKGGIAALGATLAPVGAATAAYELLRGKPAGGAIAEAMNPQLSHDLAKQQSEIAYKASREALAAQPIAASYEADRAGTLRKIVESLESDDLHQAQAFAQALPAGTAPRNLAHAKDELATLEHSLAGQNSKFVTDVAEATAKRLPAMEDIPATITKHMNRLISFGEGAAREAGSYTGAAFAGAELPVLLASEASKRGEALHPIKAMAVGLGAPVKVTDLSPEADGYALLLSNMPEAARLYQQGYLSHALWTELTGDPRLPSILQAQAEKKKAAAEQANAQAMANYERNPRS